MQLKGKIVVVTGAGRGLGRATALLSGKEGGKIVAVARTLKEIDDTANIIKESRGEAIAIRADVRDHYQVKNLFEEIDKVYGGIDILINNAGVGVFGPLEEISDDDFEEMLAVNLKGTVYCSQEAFIRMKRTNSGHIVNIISTTGKTGKASECQYAASKWAVSGLTESMKLEGKPFGIRVTSFCPGGMNTSFWETPNARKHQPNHQQFMNPDIVAKILLNVILLPESVFIDDIVIKRR